MDVTITANGHTWTSAFDSRTALSDYLLNWPYALVKVNGKVVRDTRPEVTPCR